jgi:hypothetical protein
VDTFARSAQIDFEDVCAADTLISFLEQPRCNSRGARHAEFGIGLALGKRLILVGQHREHVFHWLPQIELYETWRECLRRLASVSTDPKLGSFVDDWRVHSARASEGGRFLAGNVGGNPPTFPLEQAQRTRK